MEAVDLDKKYKFWKDKLVEGGRVKIRSDLKQTLNEDTKIRWDLNAVPEMGDFAGEWLTYKRSRGRSPGVSIGFAVEENDWTWDVMLLEHPEDMEPKSEKQKTPVFKPAKSNQSTDKVEGEDIYSDKEVMTMSQRATGNRIIKVVRRAGKVGRIYVPEEWIGQEVLVQKLPKEENPR